MRRASALLGLVAAVGLIGCGAKPSPLPRTGHSGTVLELPDRKGFVEIVTERPPAPRGSRRRAAPPATIVAYFYQPDGSTPMDPPPTEVGIKVGAGEGRSTVPLAPAPALAGGAKAAAFATGPGHYPSGFAGEINALLDGQPVTVPFHLR